jgi:hypothetical protein
VRLQGKFGHFEPDSGREGHAQSTWFSLWSQIREHVFPRHLWFLILVGIANAILIVAKSRRFDRTTFDRAVTALHAWVVIVGVIAFVIVTAAAGSFASRHMFLFNVAFDACCLLSAVHLVSWLLRRAGNGHAAPNPS